MEVAKELALRKAKPKPSLTEITHDVSHGAPCVYVRGYHKLLRRPFILLAAACDDRAHGQKIATEWLTANEARIPRLLGHTVGMI